jgi:hypothetical protein
MVLVCYISPRALISIYAWYSGVVELEYYIYGIQYSKEEWKTALSDHTGLPWYKTPGIIERF